MRLGQLPHNRAAHGRIFFGHVPDKLAVGVEK
jgi:hypothetical protein